MEGDSVLASRLSVCPLCDKAHVCTMADDCWCMHESIPPSLLHEVASGDLRTCVCKPCLQQHQVAPWPPQTEVERIEASMTAARQREARKWIFGGLAVLLPLFFVTVATGSVFVSRLYSFMVISWIIAMVLRYFVGHDSVDID